MTRSGMHSRPLAEKQEGRIGYLGPDTERTDCGPAAQWKSEAAAFRPVW
jgi:hypothetical protein